MYISSFDGTGQYAQGGASTCGLAALNAVRIILGRERTGITGVGLLERIISKEMVNVSLDSSFPGHTSLEGLMVE